MALTFDDILQKIKTNLEGIELPTGFDLNLATSEEFINHWSPLLIPLIAFFQHGIETASDEKTESVIDFLKPFKDDPPQPSIPLTTEAFTKLGSTYLDDAEAIYNWVNKTSPFKQFLRVVRAGTWFFGIISSQMAINQEKARQTLNEDQRPFILDVGTLVDMYFKDPSLKDEILATLSKYGINDVDISRLLDNAIAPYPEAMIRKLYYLKDLSDVEAKNALYRLRYSKDDFPRIEKAWRLLPGLSDITRFAVREAYKDSLSIEGELDVDRPASFDAAAEEIGADPDYSKLTWRAHWELPSFGMGREMLHRGIIESKEELLALMKENDMHPGWRDKMIALSYRIYTRVDLRRLYQIGELDDIQVKAEYQKQGYDPDQAQALTNLTTEKYNPENKALTKSDILKLYKHNEFSYEETITAFQSIGYSTEVASDVILRHDLDLAAKLMDKKEGAIKKGYVGKILDYNQTVSRMQGLGYENSYARSQVDEWIIDRELRIKDISLETLEKLYSNGIRSPQNCFAYLQRMGFDNDDSTDIIALWEQDAE